VFVPLLQDVLKQQKISISGTGYEIPKLTRSAIRLFTACTILLLLRSPALAHDIITTKLTYSRDISRIFARRCVSCHAANASIPLVSYQTARPWAVAIKEQVLSRAMPPWGAVKGFGDLSPDAALSQEEILIISAWVVGGAPEGDPATLPKNNIAVPPAPLGSFVPALQVSTKTTLARPLRLAGLRPEDSATSARITAQLPDGRIEPLVWLYRYDARAQRTFRFRTPISLPAGTVIESTAPVRFMLETTGHSEVTGTVKETVLTTPRR
jgi:hypothetical protein